ncbi:choice-of-anchor A family protein [Saccharophagus degradans]|uniref:putative Ig domain-containing protein n=1 Tax=Saccharophagus degradans TaxID=86304 RepID=UPI0024782017|nr:putative Ig domain-containing protein [Saccharophagus degradans]WGO96915.1 choice-of-anchor A family protein [Saccharophagus degradans]
MQTFLSRNCSAFKLFSAVSIRYISIIFFCLLSVCAKYTSANQAFENALTYNAFILGDFSSESSDVQGRLAIGGDAYLRSYGVASSLDSSPSFHALTVGGNVNYDNGQVFTGSIVAAGDVSAVSASVVNGMEFGAEVLGHQQLAVDFDEHFNSLRNFSQTLNGLADTGFVEFKWGGIYLEGDCESTTQVFHLDAASVLASNHLVLTCVPENSTLLLNLNGLHGGFKNIGLSHLASRATRILFNFPEANTLALTSVGVEGTILAPFAHVENPTGAINGTVIAASWNGPMEIHHVPYIGNTFSDSQPPNNNLNHAPVIESTPETGLKVGQQYYYQVLASDEDLDPLSYQLLTESVGIILTDSHTVEWTPGENQIGEHPVVIVVSDGKEAVNQEFTLVVEPANYAPVLQAISDQHLFEYESLNIELVAEDQDGDVLTFTLSQAPEFVSINGSTLSINPLEQSAGVYQNITVTVSDGELSATQTFTVNVDAPNRAPVIEPISDYFIEQGETISLRVKAVDPDNDPLAYGLQFAPSGVGICTMSGYVIWSTNVEPGVYPMIATVQDTHGAVSSEMFVVTVYAPQTNSPPVIYSSPSLTVEAGSGYLYSVVAQDPDGDEITYSLGMAPTGMQISETEGGLFWQPEISDVGAHQIEVKVTDSQGAYTSQSYTLSVVSPPNQAPVAQDSLLNVDEDQSVSFSLQANDEDGDVLTYTFLTQPSSGVLSGETPNLVYTPSAHYYGEDEFTFMVSDGELDSNQAIVTINVEPINDKPIANSQSLTTEENTEVSITLTAVDIESQTLEYSVLNQPSSGTLSGLPPHIVYSPNPTFVGTDEFSFIANDGIESSESAKVLIEVRPINYAPRFVSTPNTFVAENSSYVYKAEAIDDNDGDVLTYAKIDGPNEFTIDPTTGDVNWMASAVEPSPIQAELESCQENGETDELLAKLAGAIKAGADYIGPETVEWYNRESCLGCHVQAQSLNGLAGSLYKADFHPVFTRDIFNQMVGSRQDMGFIGSSHNGTLKNQSILGIWGLNAWPNIEESFLTRYKAFEKILWQKKAENSARTHIYWTQDHETGWMSIGAKAVTAIAAENIAELTRDKAELGETQITDYIVDHIRQPFSRILGSYNRDGKTYITTNSGIYDLQVGASKFTHIYGSTDETFTDVIVKEDGTLYLLKRDSFVHVSPEGIRQDYPLDVGVFGFLTEWNNAIYFSSSATNRIYHYNGGEIEIFSEGGLLNELRGLTVSDKNRLLAASAGGRQIIEVNNIGEQRVYLSGIPFRPIAIEPAGDGEYYLLTEGQQNELWHTNAGLYRVRKNKTIERMGDVHEADIFYSILTENDYVYVTTNWSYLSRYTKTTLDTSLLDQIEPEKEKIANFLLDGVYEQESETLIKAFELVGLAEIQDVVANTQLKTEINTAITWLDQELRSRQLPDGGWGRFDTTEASDPLVSAWVGMALNYLEPKIDDAQVRALIAYLVRSQNDEGFWNSQGKEESYFGTDFGSTGIVMAYLPKVYQTMIDLPDISISNIEYNSQANVVSAMVKNRGKKSVPRAFNVQLYIGEELIQSLEVPGMAVAEEQAVEFANIPTDSLGEAVRVVVDNLDGVHECIEQNNATAAHPVRLRVTDQLGLSDEQTFMVQVVEQNVAPRIVGLEETPDLIGDLEFTYDLIATDPNIGDQAVFELQGEPDGMFVNRDTGRIFWRPDYYEYGLFEFDVIIRDLEGLSETRRVSVNVNPNQPPYFTTTPITQVEEDVVYQYDADALDPEELMVTYTSTSISSSSLNIDILTGELIGDDLRQYAQSVSFEGSACSGADLRVGDIQVNPETGTILVQVTNIGSVDQLTPFSVQITSTNNMDVVLASGIVSELQAQTSTSVELPINLSLIDGGAVAYLSLANASYEVVFSDGFELSTAGYNARLDRWDITQGSVDVVLNPTACLGGQHCLDLDGSTLSAGHISTKQQFSHGEYILKFDVLGRPLRGPDVFTVELGAYQEAFTIPEFEPWTTIERKIFLTGTNSSLSFKHAGGDNLGAVIDNVELQRVVTTECSYENNFTLAPYLDLRVVDYSGQFGFQQFVLNVHDSVNEAPEFNAASLLNEKITLDFEDFDEPFCALETEISSDRYLAKGVILDSNGQGATICKSLAIEPIAEGSTAGTSAQTYGIASAIAASEGITVHFVGVNKRYYSSPVGFVSVDVIAASASELLSEGTQLIAYDADDKLIGRDYAKVNSLRDTLQIKAEGIASVVLVSAIEGEVFDNLAYSRTNRNLVFADESYSAKVNVTDADRGDLLSYQLVNAPDGMHITERTGYITWQPNDSLAGAHEFSIVVTDLRGASTSIDTSFEVVVNQSPVIISTPSLTAMENVNYTYQIEAIDPDGDSIEFAVISAPSSIGLDTTEGALTWLPTIEDIGIHTIKVAAYDSLGGWYEQSFELEVQPFNSMPTAIAGPDQYITIDNTVQLNAAASYDLENDALSYAWTILTKPEDSSALLTGSSQVDASFVADVAGQYVLQLVVHDGRLASTPSTVTINAFNAGELLAANVSVNPANPVEGGEVTLTVVPQNVTGTLNVTAELDGNPLTLDQNLTAVFTASGIGNHTVFVTLEDERAIATASVGFVVQDPSTVNTIPDFVAFNPPRFAAIGESYQYSVDAVDADGDVIVYSLTSNTPAGMTIDASSGQISWVPATVGVYTVGVRIADALGYRENTYSINVVESELPLAIEGIIDPAIPNEGDDVTLYLQPSNVFGDLAITAALNGVPLDVENNFTASFIAPAPGGHSIEITADDGRGAVSQTLDFFVRDPNDVTPPTIEIISPSYGQSVTTFTDVVLTVTDENLISYRVLYKLNSESEWIELAAGDQSITNEVVATIDPTTLINGSYSLGVEAVDIGGNGANQLQVVNFIVEGDLKVGNFSFSVVDLNIPMEGIPIQVSRTYDSNRRHIAGDFGYGWTIDYQNVRIEESSEPTESWYQTSQYLQFNVGASGLVTLEGTCTYPFNDKNVTVTLPNGDVEKFSVRAHIISGGVQAVSDPNCYMVAGRDISLRFDPVGDTQSTLELQSDIGFYLTDVNNGHLAFSREEVHAHPVSLYRLTTRSGYIYSLNQSFGIESVITPNGHTLTYSNSGISHSSGKSISFNRNSAGFIESITDPKLNIIQYNIEEGDLTAVAHPVSEETTSTVQYTYNNNHGLVDIIDPLNRRVVKNIYDDNGRLTAQEDQAGNRKIFDHDLDANSSVVTDLDNRTTVYNYDDEGNVTEEIIFVTSNLYAGDIVTSYTYDANGNQETKTINGKTWVTLHNDDNDVTSSCNPLEECVYYEDYNERGQEGRIVDERNNVYVMGYDSVGNLQTIQSPEVVNPETGELYTPTATNVINIYGQVESTTDLNGLTTTYTYYPNNHDNAGQKRTESNPITGTVTFTYDANNNLLTETRERTVNDELIEETVTYQYDAQDRVTHTYYPDDSFTQTVYDLAGNIDMERDRFGVWTDYTYDAYGRLTYTLYADGSEETRTYTLEGLLETVTDRSNTVMRYEYDDAGRQWKVHNDTVGTFTETQYTKEGWVKYEWDESRNLTEYMYNAAGRREKVIRTTDGVISEHIFTYYPNGELHTETDALKHTTTYVLNSLDQRVETQYHNGTATQTHFNAMGARIRTIDQEHRSVHFGLDALGRLETVTPEVEIDGQAVPDTRYTYDEVGNRLTQTDANNHVTIWAYDYYGRVLSRRLPEGMSESFVYIDGEGCSTDAGLNCAAATSPRLQIHTDFNGDTITTAFDVMGQVVSVSYSKDGTTEVYDYYSNGQLRTVEDGQGQTVYLYDALGRLSTKDTTAINGVSMRYDYDDVGNRTLVEITRDGVITSSTSYTYDSQNRLETATDNTGTTTYTYDLVGNLNTVAYPNGLVTDYDYNSVNQLTDVYTRDALGVLISHYNYALSATGRREIISELDGRTTAYCYDSMYRLSEEVIFENPAVEITESCVQDTSAADYVANYQYDWVGNRTYETVNGVQTAYTYDSNDRLEATGGTSYTYDNNGNTLTETLDGVVKTYTWNAKNKLVALDNAGEQSSYTYDYTGIRASKTAAGVTTQFVVDENRDYAQVLEEVVDGEQVVSYSYGHDLLSQDRAGEYRFYHYDGLGSTRALSDGSGMLTDTYDYEAFGEVLGQEGGTENSYLFTGEQFDGSLDQYYLRARYYDQGVGRFTQMDTWMGNNHDPITLHKYLYANADPGNMVDPTGNFSIGSTMTAVNIVGTLVGTAQTAVTVFNVASGREEFDAKALGTAILFNMVGGTASKLVGLTRGLRRTCNSFEGSTLVSTGEGLVPISEIKIGDLVWAYNEETGEKSLQEVVHLIQAEGDKSLVDIKLQSGVLITATAEHPFYIIENESWINAGELNTDHELFGFSGDLLKISGVNSYEVPAKVYNITVANDHNYYVSRDEVLSHNMGACRFPTVDTTARNHILRGDISSGGRITGYHHRFGNSDSGPLRLVEVTARGRGAQGGQGGVYEGIVEFVDAQGRAHRKRSTFFPNNWSTQRVMSEIDSAMLAAMSRSGGSLSGTVQGKSASGIDIEMVINGGRLVTAYPLLR